MNTKILAFGFLLWLFIFVIDLVRREQLTFKYAAGWILLSVFGMILVVFDHLVRALATFCGFVLTSNFIFFSCIAAGIFVSLLLTIFLCQQNNRNDRIAQKIGFLEHQIEELKKKIRL